MLLELLVIPLTLSLAHFIGLHRTHLGSRQLDIIRSYSAGFSISYVFLILLPELTLIANGNSNLIWILLLIGFSLFHVSHKLIFRIKHTPKQKNLLLSGIHLITAALYNFLISFSLVQLYKIDPTRSLVIILLLIIHTILSEISHASTQRDLINKIKIPTIIIATLSGGILPMFDPSRLLTAILFSISAGAMIYISIREELPDKELGRPWIFLAGVTTFIFLVHQLTL